MPKTNARADAHVKKAISFLQKCPAATVKEGMLIAGFSKKEIEDRAKQAWIYHRRDKAEIVTNYWTNLFQMKTQMNHTKIVPVRMEMT